MVGVDTNVLIRAVLDDHPTQAKLSKKLLKKLSADKKLFVSSYAILEMVWVLKVKKHSHHDICEALLDLIDSPGIVLGQREVLVRAVELYSTGKADFGDYLILAEGEFYDAPTLATFDRTFSKAHPHAKRLEECC